MHWFERDVSFLMRSSKGLGSIYLQKLKIIQTSESPIIESWLFLTAPSVVENKSLYLLGTKV